MYTTHRKKNDKLHIDYMPCHGCAVYAHVCTNIKMPKYTTREKRMDWHKHHGPMAKIGQAQISCIIPLYPAILAKHPLLFSLNMKIPKLPIPRFPNNKNRIASPSHEDPRKTHLSECWCRGRRRTRSYPQGQGVQEREWSEILNGYIPELENLNTPRVGGKSHCVRSIFLESRTTIGVFFPGQI